MGIEMPGSRIGWEAWRSAARSHGGSATPTARCGGVRVEGDRGFHRLTHERRFSTRGHLGISRSGLARSDQCVLCCPCGRGVSAPVTYRVAWGQRWCA